MVKVVDHDQRRREIAEVTARIIADGGMEVLTTRRIAREIGCSLGILSHYYANKNEIVIAALHWADERMEQTMAATALGSVTLDNYADVVINLLPLDEQSDREWRVRSNMMTYSLSHLQLQREQQSKLALGYKLGADFIGRLQQAGELRADIDAVGLARDIVDMVFGIALNMLHLPIDQRATRSESILKMLQTLRP